MGQKKGRNKNNTDYDSEDYYELTRGGAGMRKQQRKKKRKHDKKHLNDVCNGRIDPDAYQDYIESGW